MALPRTATAVPEHDVADVVLRIAAQLQAHLDSAGLPDEITRLAAEALGCEWCVLYLDAEGTPGTRPVGTHGVGRSPLPDGRALRLEVARRVDEREGRDVPPGDGACQTLVVGPAAGGPPLVCAPLRDELGDLGLLVAGYATATPALAPAQRRLAFGIAQSAAVALRNARRVTELQAAARRETEVVATMSHELRTPMNLVVGYLDMLADESFGPLSAPQRELLDSTRRSAVELLDLMNATLQLSRLDAGRVALESSEFDLDAFLGEVGRECTPLAAAGVRLGWGIAGEAGPVCTDRSKLKIVLRNLVGNALKFTERGSVDVLAGADGDALVLAVRDTGVGIHPAELPFIFERFRQGSVTAARGASGVGLGLHIVQRLVDMLGGVVTVESEQGAGTRFVVRIPGALAARAAG